MLQKEFMPKQIDKIFKAIADPTRRDIFHFLIVSATALPINQISNQFDISRQGVTKHIKVLEEAQLVFIKSSGRERYCLANPKPLKEVSKWMQFYEQFWDDALENLSQYLENYS